MRGAWDGAVTDLAGIVSWTREDALDWAVGAGLQIVLTIILAVVVRALAHRAISGFVEHSITRGDAARAERGTTVGARAERALARATGAAHERHKQRTETMGSLLRSITTVVVAGVAVLTILPILGIPLAPLLASAGVGGVAIGFGAQSLVKDFLSGIFMILEDQFGVGDLVDTGEVTGTVEEVSLRVTRVRDGQGVVWYVRNGEIVRIANHSQGWATASVDLPFSYREDVERVSEIVASALDGMDTAARWRDALLEAPQVLGVETITAGTVTLRVLARCAPDTQWGVQREIRRRVKDAFDREGVAGPPVLPVGGPAGATGTSGGSTRA